jgi:hypothetical protein
VLERLNQDALLGVIVVLAIVYVIFVASGFRGRHVALAVALAVAALLHVVFAEIGWYERYQAYLVIAGLLFLLQIGTEVIAPRWREAALAGLAVAIILFSVARIALLTSLPLASSNTYRQQYQIGRFMDRYYDGKPIAVQDLGYIAFLHDGPVVDLNGLGSHEVLELMQDDRLDRRAMERLIERNRVQAIALFADAYGIRLPENWVPVGEWQLGQKKVSPLYSTVTFYAPSEAQAAKLARQLRDFRAELPAGVKTLNRDQMLERAFKRLGALEAPSDIGSDEGSSSVIP